MRRPKPHNSCHSEPGLQPERTDLAWRRTALTLTLLTVSALFLRWTPLDGWVAVMLVVGAGAAAGITILSQRKRYLFAVRRVVTADSSTPLLAMFSMSFGVSALAAIGIFTVLFLPAPR